MKFFLFRTLFLVVLFTCIAALVYGQDAAPSPTKNDGKYSESTGYSPRVFPTKKKESKNDQKAGKTPGNVTISAGSSPSTLSIPVSVFTDAGTLVTDLKNDEFSAFVDGEPAEIQSIEQPKQPVNVFLLVDVSPSTEERIKEIKELAVQTVNQLEADDRIIVASFADSLKIFNETNDRKLVEKEIRKLKEAEGTALYNALTEIVTKYDLSKGINALVLITDGVDTTSKKNNYEKSLMAVERANVKAFVVYLNTFADNFATIGGLQIPYGVIQGYSNKKGSLQDDYLRGRLYLTDLMQLSGGHSIPVRTTPDKNPWLDLLSRELHGQYVLTIKTPGTTLDRHNIKIRVARSQLTVLAKGSYLDQ
jgi:VWFA-related protein